MTELYSPKGEKVRCAKDQVKDLLNSGFTKTPKPKVAVKNPELKPVKSTRKV